MRLAALGHGVEPPIDEHAALVSAADLIGSAQIGLILDTTQKEVFPFVSSWRRTLPSTAAGRLGPASAADATPPSTAAGPRAIKSRPSLIPSPPLNILSLISRISNGPNGLSRERGAELPENRPFSTMPGAGLEPARPRRGRVIAASRPPCSEGAGDPRGMARGDSNRRRLWLSAAHHQLDREVPAPYRARSRVLSDHAADSPRAGPTGATNPAAPDADPRLRPAQREPDHPWHAAAHRRRRRWRWLWRRLRWRRWRWRRRWRRRWRWRWRWRHTLVEEERRKTRMWPP